MFTILINMIVYSHFCFGAIRLTLFCVSAILWLNPKSRSDTHIIPYVGWESSFRYTLGSARVCRKQLAV